MARKQKHAEHENHERWLISYADFITLLFAFFVVMYSVSAVNEGKFRVLSEALVAAFRSQPKSLTPLQVGAPAKAATQPKVAVKLPVPICEPPQHAGSARNVDAQQETTMKEMAEELERAMLPLIKAELVTVRRDEYWLEVEIKASVLFASGSAALQPEATPILQKIAGIMKEYPNPIRVEGFTDNKPISTTVFPSNWELSTARSARVVRLFTGEGIEPKRMAAMGFGEYRAVAPNDTEEGRSKNRRVVLVVPVNEEKPIVRM